MKAASVRDLLGFNPRKGESAAPFPQDEEIALTTDEVERYLALSREDAGRLKGRGRREFEAALFTAPAEILKRNSWQYQERERIDRERHTPTHAKVIQETDASSSLDHVSMRAQGLFGGHLAFG